MQKDSGSEQMEMWVKTKNNHESNKTSRVQVCLIHDMIIPSDLIYSSLL
jgi:hypothetical protein